MALFHIVTLGCKVNQCESENLARNLSAAGHQATRDPAQADIFIVNTCGVTGRAAMQSRQAVRRLLRQQPRARVVVTGCSVQTEPEAFGAIPGVTHLIGHGEKGSIPQILDDGQVPATITEWQKGAPPPPLRQLLPDEDLTSPQSNRRTRAFFKIQDGCNGICTYCIVPRARGPSRSLSFDDVLAGLARYARWGYHEVVLTGIHLGQWGRDLNPPSTLEQLLAGIDRSRSLERVRLSSIEPHELSDGIIARVAQSSVLTRHFHIPLQSGDNGILKRMGRPYTREQYQEHIEKIRAALPDAGIGADVMVGFPGEDSAAFAQTRELIETLPLTYLHVFPFSPRPGTPACHYDRQVPPGVSKQRAAALRALGKTKQNDFLASMVGRTVEVLVTGPGARQPQTMEGMTANYVKIRFPGGNQLRNRLLAVKALKVGTDGGLVGQISGSG